MKITKSGCWEWQGSNDYGVIKIGDKGYKAHRLTYTLFIGSLRPHEFVCHRCDNPVCCNPDHLFSGTARDNSQDALKKGRLSERTFLKKGEEHRGAKLTEAHVKWARREHAKGVSVTQIAKYLKVGVSTAYDAIHGKSWKHIRKEGTDERHSRTPENVHSGQGKAEDEVRYSG